MIFLQEQTYQFSHQHQQGYSTSQMKLVDFLQLWNQQATFCHIPDCLVGQIQVQKANLVWLSQIKSLISPRGVSSIIDICKTILQIALSARSLMYRRKNAGPRMEPWGTPATQYTCKRRSIQNQSKPSIT